MSALQQRLQAALADRYRIERELGAGGMATVYLAHDLKHERKVAIKVLKPELAAVIGGVRFLTEIRTTANLQHPHILSLHDSGEVDGTVFYVMPFVDGESLRDRLAREKQLPIDDALRIASEVAGALQYAHDQGVIHRDIKPENILLHGGHALVADFGIALAASATGGARMTETGMSLGTPTYMSPEQAMGDREITPRSDVYALGAMTYEMLLGEPPFMGPTAQSIVAKVLTEKPSPMLARRERIPAHVEDAVLTALEKLPADRQASASAFAQMLDGSHGTGRVRARVAGASRPASRVTLLLGVVAILAVIATVSTTLAVRARRAVAVARLGRFALSLPPGQELLAPGGVRLAWSPDGDAFVYPGPGKGRSRLWLRRLGDLEATPIAGSDGATSPTFSPDGTEIAFVTLSPFAAKIVSLSDGQSRTVTADSLSGGGLAWGPDGYLYCDGGNGLIRLRPDGSDRSMVLPLDTLKGEAGVAWPTLLPDGRGLLVRIRRVGDSPADYRIVVFDLRTGARKELVRGLVAVHSATGHLLWITADGVLHGQRFDLDRLETVGKPVALWAGHAIAGFGASDLALSREGDLVYVPGATRVGFSQLAWVTRDGKRTPVDTSVIDGLIGSFSLSPDGSAVALGMLRPSDASTLQRIWVKRLSGGPTQLVTSENEASYGPVWSPDGRDLLYSQAEATLLFRRRADGSGSPELAARSPRGFRELTLHPDGRTLVARGNTNARPEMFWLRLGTDSAPKLLLRDASGGTTPALSPDGRWLAYVSLESGKPEVYVRPFPDADTRKVQVSVDGGVMPRWSRVGGELFFISGAGDMMSAKVEHTPTFRVLGISRLFTPIGFQGTAGNTNYEVTPDGKRFLMLDITGQDRSGSSESIVVVLNLAGELMKRLSR